MSAPSGPKGNTTVLLTTSSSSAVAAATRALCSTAGAGAAAGAAAAAAASGFRGTGAGRGTKYCKHAVSQVGISHQLKILHHRGPAPPLGN